jgi:hypothetical protein
MENASWPFREIHWVWPRSSCIVSNRLRREILIDVDPLLALPRTWRPLSMMRRGRAITFRWVSVTLVVLSILGGCGGSSDPAADAMAVRDSAGVRVVHHAQGSPSDTLAFPPALQIGLEGDPDFEFFGTVRVGALSSGNIVVANGGTPELRFYGPNGRHIRTVGRAGEGPAEFGFLSDVIVRTGDTVIAVDPRRSRLVYFDSAGTFQRGESFAQDLTSTTPEGARCAFPGFVGLLANGARVVRGWGCTESIGSDGMRPTLTPIEIVRDGSRDSVGIFNGFSVWERSSEEMGPRYFHMMPFGSRISWASGPDRIFLSEGVDYEVLVYDERGGLSEIWREGGLPPELRDDDRELYLELQIAADQPHPNDVPFPDRVGGYDRFVRSHHGDLWARQMPGPSDTGGRWTVFASDGRLLRRVVLPEIEVTAVRDGRIYGTVQDELDVTSVVVLEVPPLQQGSGGGERPSPP